jgi:hypothetical protein
VGASGNQWEASGQGGASGQGCANKKKVGFEKIILLKIFRHPPYINKGCQRHKIF